MLNWLYARLLWRYLWRRFLTPAGWRWQTDGPGLLRQGPPAPDREGRRGPLRRASAGSATGPRSAATRACVEIGAKTVFGQECTISSYKRVADRRAVRDRRPGDVHRLRPRRRRGRAADPPAGDLQARGDVGANVWIGYNACFLRGVRVGDNSIVGTNSVVTKDVPANAVVGGVPAKVIRMRDDAEGAALAGSGRARAEPEALEPLAGGEQQRRRRPMTTPPRTRSRRSGPWSAPVKTMNSADDDQRQARRRSGR